MSTRAAAEAPGAPIGAGQIAFGPTTVMPTALRLSDLTYGNLSSRQHSDIVWSMESEQPAMKTLSSKGRAGQDRNGALRLHRVSGSMRGSCPHCSDLSMASTIIAFFSLSADRATDHRAASGMLKETPSAVLQERLRLIIGMVCSSVFNRLSSIDDADADARLVQDALDIAAAGLIGSNGRDSDRHPRGRHAATLHTRRGD